jgi:hypothetical protein
MTRTRARTHTTHTRNTDYYIHTHSSSPQGGIASRRHHRLKAASPRGGKAVPQGTSSRINLASSRMRASRPLSKEPPQGSTSGVGWDTLVDQPFPPTPTWAGNTEDRAHGGTIARGVPQGTGANLPPSHGAQLQPQGEQRPQGRTTVPRLKRRPQGRNASRRQPWRNLNTPT